jgi:hypothetical protein
MKKLILISLVIVLSIGVNSCGKETSSTTNYNIYQVPVDIAATYVIMAFSNATTGINYQLEKAVGYTAMGAAAFDSIVTLKKTDSAATVKYTYQVISTFAVITSSPLKTSLDYTSNGWFSSATFRSQDQPEGDWIISVQDASHLGITGTGNDTGAQDDVTENVLFTSQIAYTLQSVLADKMTYMVTSGTAQVTILGNGPGNVSFRYSGTLTFSGNRQAVLVLGGSTYNFSLTTGTISK